MNKRTSKNNAGRLDIIKSPAAERMLKNVTNGFYDNSRTALWMFEVIGREYDEMGDWARNLQYETRPQTCTWSIGIWENIYGIEPDETLGLEQRRERILSKKLSGQQINPNRIAAVLSTLTGCPVTITDPISPYTFKVLLTEDADIIVNYSEVLKTLRRIKPSHLSFRFFSEGERTYPGEVYAAGAITDNIFDPYIEEPPIAETAETYYGGGITDYITEIYIESPPTEIAADGYNGGAITDYITEIYKEEAKVEQ